MYMIKVENKYIVVIEMHKKKKESKCTYTFSLCTMMD